MAVRDSDVRFSNRPFEVKHFQTIRHCSVDVAHGLVLLFGIGTKGPSIMGFEDEAEQSFGRPCRQSNGRNQADIRTHLIHRPARDILPPVDLRLPPDALIFWAALPSIERQEPSGHTNSPHPSSREGHPSTGGSQVTS